MEPDRIFPYRDTQGIVTHFIQADSSQVYVQQLCGMMCGNGGEDNGPNAARGLAVLADPCHLFEGDQFHLVSSQFDPQGAAFVWSLAEDDLQWESRWHFDLPTGIWSRKDALHNLGQKPMTLTRCLARFSFSPNPYEIYTQGSSWTYENQGIWQAMHHGRFSLHSQGGRTTQGGTPYLCLRSADSLQGIVFHILPRGNWTIQANASYTTTEVLQPYAILEMGLSDEGLCLKLQPGEHFELPEILIQPLPTGQPEEAAPALHRYAHSYILQGSKRAAPVIYNTWFDVFEFLDVPRLRSQLQAAKTLGCEIFTVDAGWYGASDGNWFQQAGDWREKTSASFHGQMTAFAEEVRCAGLGFGLWMEPERNSLDAPTVKAHPEWFRPGGDGYFYPDLENPATYAYIYQEMSRLIETYQLVWMKVDFNFSLGHDSSNLSHYYNHWYALLDELRARFPQLFLEGCASGGMRSDLNTVSHFHAHFLSDTIHPIDTIRINQGALLRLPPGRLSKWLGLRPVMAKVARYGLMLDQTPDAQIAPGGANWENSITVDPHFAFLAALPGALGLSGDIAGLSAETKMQLIHDIAFYKDWRELMAGSIAHLLTPVKSKDDRSGWVAIQLQNPEFPASSLLFIYRLADGMAIRWFPLRGLKEQENYQVTSVIGSETRPQTIQGANLMNLGLRVDLPAQNRAAVFILQEKEDL